MLENLEPAKRVTVKNDVRPGIEFDGATGTGTATTPGYLGEQTNFDDYLREAGFNPDEIEVTSDSIRTSRWQRYDGEWLTSYRFYFRRKTAIVNLPALLAEAKRRIKPKPITTTENRALVVLWSDLQVGKTDHRGSSFDGLVERVALMQSRLVATVKREKPNKIVFVDCGDTVEGFDNKASANQLQSNDLSIMEQVDLATTMAWQTLKQLVALVPDVTYLSVGSNHCQWRVNGQQVGKKTDDWGIFIGRQLARLATEQELPIRFVEPQPHDESLCLDVFSDGFHRLGVVHGHQAARPDAVGDWWRKQAFGRQPVSDASLLVHGHFHHLRVQELGSTLNGGSRFLIGAATMDNGSNWWRTTSGEDSVPGLVCFVLEQGVDFTGTVWKL
jgi:hypothetical protein